MFAHMDLFHLGFNSLALLSFGPTVCRTLGSARFLRFYLAGGTVSSIFSLAYHYSPQYQQFSRSLGASGAINATVVFWACMFPSQTIYLYFVPLPARIAAGLFVGYDLYNALYSRNSKIDNAGHLGGALFGYLYYRMRLLRF